MNTETEYLAFLSQPLEGDLEDWIADRIAANLTKSLSALAIDVIESLYVIGIGVDPGVNYAVANINTDNAWDPATLRPPAPELTGRFVPNNWKALDDSFIVFADSGATDEEASLIKWRESFYVRYPAERDIDPHLGFWRVTIEGIRRFRVSDYGRFFCRIPIMAIDLGYSSYSSPCSRLMSPDGQLKDYLDEIKSGVAI